jgi:hypothetical protein
MLAPVTHILPLTTIRRERLLPVNGRVTARLNQKVTALDVVAEANLGQEHILIDVAATLGIRSNTAQRLIQVKTGQVLSKGQVIAQRISLIPQTLRTPASGRVLLVGNGRVLIEVGESNYELRAGLPGTVTQQINERGVEITFNGALVQGVWGNGQVGLGLMLPILSAPDEVLSKSQIDVSLRGSILLAGHCDDPEILQTAGELPVRGMIFGSLSAALIPLALKIRYPIVVVDGFSHKPMNSIAYKLLTTNGKREVTLNAEPFDRHSGVRPEIFIPLPVTQELGLPREVDTFAAGQLVRVTRAPFAYATGTVISLMPGLATAPSGLRAPTAEIRLESGEQIRVPLVNLEVIG